MSKRSKIQKQESLDYCLRSPLPMTELLSLCSVQHPPQGFQRLPSKGIPWLNLQSFLEAANRLRIHLFAKICAAQIVVRKMARFVAPGINRLLQPRNGLIETALLDHVSADIIVWIAEVRIDFDGALAFQDGVFQPALEMICPAKKSMRFARLPPAIPPSAGCRVMKAIGGSMRRVLRLFLAEAALLGLAGGLIGAAVGIVISIGLGKAVFGVAAQPRLIVYPISVALTIIVAILAAYPLRRLVHIRPASVFRGEE